jgi:hypothetical protein
VTIRDAHFRTLTPRQIYRPRAASFCAADPMHTISWSTAGTSAAPQARGAQVGQYECVVEQQRRGRAVAALVVAVAILVAVNVAIFTWLYAPAMLAVELTIIVFVVLGASIIRSACCDRRANQ